MASNLIQGPPVRSGHPLRSALLCCALPGPLPPLRLLRKVTQPRPCPALNLAILYLCSSFAVRIGGQVAGCLNLPDRLFQLNLVRPQAPHFSQLSQWRKSWRPRLCCNSRVPSIRRRDGSIPRSRALLDATRWIVVVADLIQGPVFGRAVLLAPPCCGPFVARASFEPMLVTSVCTAQSLCTNTASLACR